MQTPRIVFIVTALTSFALASQYHFASNGDDSYTTQQAKQEATPWKSLGKLASLALTSGDTILLHRGDSLRGELVLNGWGTQANPWAVLPYGQGTLPPVIVGTETVSNWIQGSKGIWSSTLTSQVRSASRLFWNWTPLTAARSPNTGMYAMDSGYGDSAFDANILASGSWVGAHVHLRTETWNLIERSITAQNGNHISVDSPVEGALRAGWGFFINNSLAALDQPGEWFYDSTTYTLYVMPPDGSDPNLAAIELSSAENGIHTTYHTYIEGIHFVGQGNAGILAGTDVHVRNCEILNADQFGFYTYSPNIEIVQTRVIGANSFGIQAGGSSSRLDSNTVIRTADFMALGPRGTGRLGSRGTAIIANGDSSFVRYNTVDSSGYNGIACGGQGTRVFENRVDHSCLTSHDCAGIYTSGRGETFSIVASPGLRIERNIVTNSYGNPMGSPGRHLLGHGIYLDYGSQQVVVRDNVIAYNVFGVLLHNDRGSEIVHNTAYGNSEIQVFLANYDKGSANEAMYGNRVDSNLIVALHDESLWSESRNFPQDSSLGHLHDNVFCTDHALGVTCLRNMDTLWQTSKIKDSSLWQGTELLVNGNFEAANLNWGRWAAVTTLDTVKDAPLLAAPSQCLKVTRVPGDTINAGSISNAISVPVSPNNSYVLKFRARKVIPGIIGMKINMAHAPWSQLSTLYSMAVDSTWQSFILPIQITQADAGATLSFTFDQNEKGFWLDDVSWMQLSNHLDTTLASQLSFNANTNNLAIDLDGSFQWRLPDGTITSTSQVLQAFSGAAYFKDGAANSSHTNPKNTTIIAPHSNYRLVVSGNRVLVQELRANERARIFSLKGRQIMGQ